MKKGLLVIGIAGAVLGGAGVAYSATAMVNTEARITATTIKLVELKEGEEQEKTELEKFLDELNKFKDTFLVPLLGGSLGVATIVPLVTSLFNYLRTRKVVKQIADADATLAKAQDFLTKGAQALENATKALQTTEEIKKTVETYVTKVNELIKSNAKIIQTNETIKKVIKCLIELETTLAKTDKEAVASGALEEVSEIEALAKGI